MNKYVKYILVFGVFAFVVFVVLRLLQNIDKLSSGSVRVADVLGGAVADFGHGFDGLVDIFRKKKDSGGSKSGGSVSSKTNMSSAKNIAPKSAVALLMSGGSVEDAK